MKVGSIYYHNHDKWNDERYISIEVDAEAARRIRSLISDDIAGEVAIGTNANYEKVRNLAESIVKLTEKIEEFERDEANEVQSEEDNA